jgi:PAS domain S-box-containing protein
VIKGVSFGKSGFANSLVLRIGLLILLSLLAFTAALYQLIGRPTVDRLAESQIRLAAEQVEARYASLLTSVESTLRSSQGWGKHGKMEHNELLRFNEFFFPIIANHGEIASVILAHESGREIFLMLAEDGNWVNAVNDPDAWGNKNYWIFWNKQREIEKVEMQDTTYDPRQRPWFKGAAALPDEDSIFWTEPYIFFTTKDPGITASMRWKAADGSNFVIAHDVRLIDITDFTNRISVSPQGKAALLLKDGKLIAPPRDPRFASRQAINQTLMKTPEELNLPELAQAFRLWQSEASNPPKLHRFTRPDGGWVSLFQPMTGAASGLMLGVIAPESDFVPISGSDLLLLALISLSALALGMAVAIHIARRFGEPLNALAIDSTRIGRLDLEQPVATDAPWREVTQLAEALEGMRHHLQRSRKALENANADLEIKVNNRTEALQHSQDILLKREALLQALLDTIPNPIFYKGADTRFLGCNVAYEEFFGVDRQNFVGKRVLDLEYLPDAARLAYQAEDEQVIGECTRVSREMDFLDAKGNSRDTLYSVSGFRSPDGTPGGLIGVIVDISALKDAEREAERARANAESAAAAKADFLANMSHEIRTPMNAIIGMTHLALQTELDSRQKNYLSKVDNAAKGLLGIINDILDISKIEAGMMHFEHTPFSLDASLRHLSDMCSLKARDRGLELLYDIAPDVPDHLIGDSLRLGQLLLNLVGNAIKFTEIGEITLAIKVVEKNAARVVLGFEVIDTGIGMSVEQQEQLFSAFTQGDTSTTRKYGGTGLGLSICKRIVELQGGRIEVTSQPGVGSCFTFRLPFDIADGQLDVPRRIGLPDDLRALVVDDSPGACEIFTHMLNSLGIDCHAVTNGPKALAELASAKAAGRPFGLLIIDWKMPGMDGAELVARISQMPSDGKPAPIIMTTAYDHEELLAALGQHVVGSILSKPATPSSLFDSIMFALHREPQRVGGETATALRNLRFAGRHVLLVEDNEVNRELAEELLLNTGLEVDLAENGRQAIERIQQAPYDLVLMDCHMPIMDGYAATQYIREDLGMRQLPIVAMTANALASDREHCLRIGMNDHIPKPIDVALLHATLDRWLNRPDAAEPAKPAPIAEPTDAPQATADVDTAGALARLGGNRNMYNRLLVRFRENQGDVMEHLLADRASGNVDAMILRAHTLRGLAGNIGASRLANLAGDLETHLKNGLPAGDATVDALLVQLGEALPRSLALCEGVESGPLSQGQATDTPGCEDAIAELRTLLDNDDAAAVRYFEGISSRLRQEYNPATVELLACQINQYAFDKASAILEQFSLQPGSPKSPAQER